MYAKLFSQIFDSSISNDYVVRHAFMDLLALADRDGHVDMTAEAIARRTNVPLDIVLYSLERLNAPDPHSRTPAEEGRRIVLLDTHRSWGWRIVNYEEYRNMRDEEARKAYFREYKRKVRASAVESVTRPHVSHDVLDSPTMSTEAEAYTDTELEVEAEHVNLKSSGNTNLARSKSSVEEVVDAIYQAYPRKVGSGKAKPAISTALKKLGSTMAPRDAQVWLYRKVQAFARSPAGQAGALTPHPATWFNQARYHDDPAQWEIISGGTSGVFVNKSQQRSNSNIQAAANVIAEIDGREAADDFVRSATSTYQRTGFEDLRKPALEAPDRGRAGSSHQPVTIEAPGGGNSIPRPSHA